MKPHIIVVTSKLKQEIIYALYENELTAKQLTKMLGYHKQTIHNNLRELLEADIIKKTGYVPKKTRGPREQKYRITEEN